MVRIIMRLNMFMMVVWMSLVVFSAKTKWPCICRCHWISVTFHEHKQQWTYRRMVFWEDELQDCKWNSISRRSVFTCMATNDSLSFSLFLSLVINEVAPVLIRPLFCIFWGIVFVFAAEKRGSFCTTSLPSSIIQTITQ